MEITLEILIARLEQIATKNKDTFAYRIDILNARDTKNLKYQFTAIETADGHEILSWTGNTIDEAVFNAWMHLEEYLKDFGYKL